MPPHDIHVDFQTLASSLMTDARARNVFDRMAERSGIARRHSVFEPGCLARGEIDTGGFYLPGAYPTTAARMRHYEAHALPLALAAVRGLDLDRAELQRITHLVVASCTGFTAPGLDLQLAASLGLAGGVERTLVGFMGCAAAIPALRLARSAVLAEPAARVLVVNLELCTLHLQETGELEPALAALLFADGCSAALVSADEVGLRLDDFRGAVIPGTADHITCHIGDGGFLMHLSGRVPGRIAATLRGDKEAGAPDGLLRGAGVDAFRHWAVHAGGRSVLDAVEFGLGLAPEALARSRAVLRDFGNMSSATVMFVLRRILAAEAGTRGLAMAFGPGMVAETFRFRRAMPSATVMFVLDRMLRSGEDGPGLAMAFGPGMVAETFRFQLLP